MIPTDSIVIRQYEPLTDKGFVYATWLKNYKNSSYFAKRIRPAIFFKGHQVVIDHLLAKSEITALIACPKDDDQTILGYLVCEGGNHPVVHFMFVKDAFRSMGIMRALVTHSKIDLHKLVFTHWTYPVDELINKYPEIVYDPYKL